MEGGKGFVERKGEVGGKEGENRVMMHEVGWDVESGLAMRISELDAWVLYSKGRIHFPIHLATAPCTSCPDS